MKGVLALGTGGAVGFLIGSSTGRQPYEQVKKSIGSTWRALPRDDYGRLIVHPAALLNTTAGIVTLSRSNQQQGKALRINDPSPEASYRDSLDAMPAHALET